MNWLDIIICIVLLIGLYKGYLNGFFVELTSLIALIAAIYGSIYFSNFAGDWLRVQVAWEDVYITIASFIVTFLVIIFVITYVGKLITKVIKTVNLSFINKIAGAAFGLVKMGFLASVILMFINSASGEFHIIGKDIKENSIVYGHIAPLAPFLLPKILEEADRVDRQLRGDGLEDIDGDQEDLEQPQDSTGFSFF
ncbi:CvpA family protein [Nonlabens sp. Ci31]|jgi:membrane protein required for colicin V production|uniref:CvpA family protein n=1 Tax=Nonlabens sp. Ci31 TaxID=2608253 RepID=UPI0014632E98|nr:CvpA family protein [Nonlabens sp. Ci31]QJP33587.1 CvpA family protein [Nonlabens sp. Ci31]